MEQIGEVVELRGAEALVRVKRVSSCGENCSSCSGGCKPTSTTVCVINGISAKVGDTVKFQMNSASFLFLAFIGYILPIIICLSAYAVVKSVTSSVEIADAAAILSIVLTLLIFYFFDKIPHKSTRFTGRIIKILR